MRLSPSMSPGALQFSGSLREQRASVILPLRLLRLFAIVYWGRRYRRQRRPSRTHATWLNSAFGPRQLVSFSCPQENEKGAIAVVVFRIRRARLPGGLRKVLGWPLFCPEITGPDI